MRRRGIFAIALGTMGISAAVFSAPAHAVTSQYCSVNTSVGYGVYITACATIISNGVTLAPVDDNGTTFTFTSSAKVTNCKVHTEVYDGTAPPTSSGPVSAGCNVNWNKPWNNPNLFGNSTAGPGATINPCVHNHKYFTEAWVTGQLNGTPFKTPLVESSRGSTAREPVCPNPA